MIDTQQFTKYHNIKRRILKKIFSQTIEKHTLNYR